MKIYLRAYPSVALHNFVNSTIGTWRKQTNTPKDREHAQIETEKDTDLTHVLLRAIHYCQTCAEASARTNHDDTHCGAAH